MCEEDYCKPPAAAQKRAACKAASASPEPHAIAVGAAQRRAECKRKAASASPEIAPETKKLVKPKGSVCFADIPRATGAGICDGSFLRDHTKRLMSMHEHYHRCQGHEWTPPSEELTVATACSGTEMPVIVLKLIQDASEGKLRFRHLWSCEIAKEKVACIRQDNKASGDEHRCIFTISEVWANLSPSAGATIARRVARYLQLTCS